jgi:hypothetical protein
MVEKMSKRVSQSWATPAIWLVATAGSAGIIALSLAVFLAPAPKAPVALQAMDNAAPVKVVASLGTGQGRASQDTVVEPALAIAQNMPGAPPVPQQKLAQEHAVIARFAVADGQQPPVKMPQNSLDRTNPAVAIPVAKTATYLAPTSPPITSPSTGVAPRLSAPLPPSDKSPLVPPTETVTVTGYRQMALNVDGIGRGNSLTIQLPTAERKQK